MEEIDIMEEVDIEININIDIKSKKIYIDEENTSGCEYEYKNIKDLGQKISYYLKTYHNEINEEV